jgi:hypothetical protein
MDFASGKSAFQNQWWLPAAGKVLGIRLAAASHHYKQQF